MLKLEIKMDEDKIKREDKYPIEGIYRTLERNFTKYQLLKGRKEDGTLFFYGNGKPEDYGIFGYLITSLKETEWFMNYVMRWVWYNSDDGKDEEDFNVEDVLYYYTGKRSVI